MMTERTHHYEGLRRRWFHLGRPHGLRVSTDIEAVKAAVKAQETIRDLQDQRMQLEIRLKASEDRWLNSSDNWKPAPTRTEHNDILRLLYDTESNGFVANATKIHCVGLIDLKTEEVIGFRPHQIKDALQALNEAEERVGHNIKRHDEALIAKLHGPLVGARISDTMIIGRTMFPNLKQTDTGLIDAGKLPANLRGKQTVKAWGYRLGEQKGDYAEVREAELRAKGITDPREIADYVWGEFNEDMFDYMLQDCRTNLRMWKHFRPDEYPQAPWSLSTASLWCATRSRKPASLLTKGLLGCFRRISSRRRAAWSRG
jgi:hypothetical protein